MTVRAYKRVGNISLGVAIAAVLGFDSFHSHLIPGLALIGAGAVALAMNVLVRFVPLTDSIIESPTSITSESAEQKVSTPVREDVTAASGETVGTRYYARVGFSWGAEMPEAPLEQPSLGDSAFERRQAEIMARLLNERVEVGSTHWLASYRYYHRMHFPRKTAAVGSDRSVWTAVEMAKALNPQTTEYDVIVTSDGTLTISPKPRNAQEEDAQREEKRALPENSGESKYIQ